MIVAVVGNGPTAAGKGSQIDCCDFVVRLKAYWAYGALNAGKRVDAICWYGVDDGGFEMVDFRDVEFWITQEPRLFRGECEGVPGSERLERIANVAQFNVIRWMPTELFCLSDAYIGKSPTTGFSAINMALHILQPREIHLFGLDATTRDGPNSDDARRRIPDEMYTEFHDMLAEKRVIAELFRGKWLGEPCKTTLVWHDMPEALCET